MYSATAVYVQLPPFWHMKVLDLLIWTPSVLCAERYEDDEAWVICFLMWLLNAVWHICQSTSVYICQPQAASMQSQRERVSIPNCMPPKTWCEFVILLAGGSVSECCKVKGTCDFGSQQVWLCTFTNQSYVGSLKFARECGSMVNPGLNLQTLSSVLSSFRQLSHFQFMFNLSLRNYSKYWSSTLQ